MQDIARLTFMAMRNEKANKKILTFAGPRAWTTQEVLRTLSKGSCFMFLNGFISFLISFPFMQVITLCERLAGQDANVTTVPVSVLRFTRQLTRFFQWTNDVADRLAFTEVIKNI